jgi:outer membrane protein assembly factor BamB
VALNAETGMLIWEHEVTGPVDSSPAVAGDLVFVGLRDGRLLALDRANGKTQWEFSADNLIYSSPTVYRGVAYIGSGDGRVYALDAMTGEERWSYATGAGVSSAPAVHDDVVAVTSQDRHVYILDANTGRHRLDLVMSGTGLSPAIDDELAYVADNRGFLWAIDWRKRELPFEKTARWVRTQLFVWGLVDSLPPQKGFVWGFRQRGEKFVGSPVVDGDRVYIAGASGAVYALDRSDGHLVWRFKADAEITGSPSIAGQTLYVGDAEGGLYGVDTLTGESRWRFQADDRVTSTVVPANGMLYVATASGTLYAIR